VIVCRVDESTSRGAALAALEGFGWLGEGALEPVDAVVVGPDPRRAAGFAALRGAGSEAGDAR
jgi:hypothetical protein